MFHWDSEQKKAFESIKHTLSTEPVLSVFDMEKPVLIPCDASQSGLGAVLLQDNQPVAYTSRALTDAESRYAQTEKELLAIVFVFNKFHQYVYGKFSTSGIGSQAFGVYCQEITGSRTTTSATHAAAIAQVQFTITYKPGKEMLLADTLLRAYIDENDNADRNPEEDLMCRKFCAR